MTEAVLEGIPFGRQISNLATADPDGSALVVVARDGSERSMTRREIDLRTNQLARVFAAEGVGVLDRVAIELQNSIEHVLTTLACWKIGAVPVPMRWDLPDWERQRLLEVVDGKLVMDEDSVTRLFKAADDASDAPHPDVVAEQTNGICSSGSTGLPKVILAVKPQLYDEATSVPFLAAWGVPVARPQTILVPTALYHTNGFATMLSFLSGDHLVILEKFDAELVLDLIERHRVTTFTATPTMLQRIVNVPDLEKRDLSSLVWVLQGAAVIAPTLVRRWCELLGPDHFVMAYGMTEGLGLTALRGDEWMTHQGAVGRGFRETEIRIMDPEGKELPPGEIGEIYMRSPTTGQYGYLGGAPLLPTTEDGFGTAGDLGYMDEDGYLYIVDRRVDMIITGGANVFPAEVESALADHPEVADVVVIGLQDPEWGRRVHAVIEARDHANPPTAEAIIAYAKQKLAPYKVPKTVEFIDAIPRSAATKVNRSALIAERGG